MLNMGTWICLICTINRMHVCVMCTYQCTSRKYKPVNGFLLLLICAVQSFLVYPIICMPNNWSLKLFYIKADALLLYICIVSIEIHKKKLKIKTGFHTEQSIVMDGYWIWIFIHLITIIWSHFVPKWLYAFKHLDNRAAGY